MLTISEPIKQLEKSKGGYFYLKISKQQAEAFSNGKKTRLLCSIDGHQAFPCGLNHLGDGNFFIIISSKNLLLAGKKLGETATFHVSEDPNPLGVEVPEVLTVYLDQDELAKEQYKSLTDGKKRSLIYSFNRIKNIDRQIEIITHFFEKRNT